MPKITIPVWRFELVREGEITPGVKGPDQAESLARKLIPQGADREYFVAIYLNAKNQPIGSHMVSIGSLDSSLVHQREVLKPAILAGAYSFIVAHNHPSGDPEPSEEDITITHRLQEAGALLGIPLLDHIVIGTGRSFSMRREGRL